MKRRLIIILALAICGAGLPARPAVESKSSGIMLSEDVDWKAWLAANYPLKNSLSKGQAASLQKTAGTSWDDHFVGNLYADGTAGAVLLRYSPSKKTLSRFAVLRWTKDGWKALLKGERAGVLDAKGARFAPGVPVDVFQVYLQQTDGALGFVITNGEAGDKLYGDPLDLSFDARAGAYVWPDDSDHD